MKKKVINSTILIISIYLIYNIINNQFLITNSIGKATFIWFNNLVPTMLVIFIINDLLIEYNIINYFLKNFIRFGPKFFRVSSYGFNVFLLSLLSGFPSGARNIKTIYHNKLISKNEAEYLLTFTHYANPIFILSVIGSFISVKASYIILISHFISGFIVGIIFRRKDGFVLESDVVTPKVHFSKVIINSIKGSINSLLIILGILTYFMIVSELLINNFNLKMASELLIKGLLEITEGINYLGSLNISIIYKTVISSAFLSFGGVSIHMQAITEINDTDISYSPFFIARILHALISIIISLLLSLIYFSLLT